MHLFFLTTLVAMENPPSSHLLQFIESKRQNHDVVLQGLGKHYRTQGFQDADFFFNPNTPAGAIIEGVQNGTIQPDEVMVLFDVDRTLIADQEKDPRPRGTKKGREDRDTKAEDSKNMMAVQYYLAQLKIPFGMLTLRPGGVENHNICLPPSESNKDNEEYQKIGDSGSRIVIPSLQSFGQFMS